MDRNISAAERSLFINYFTGGFADEALFFTAGAQLYNYLSGELGEEDDRTDGYERATVYDSVDLRIVTKPIKIDNRFVFLGSTNNKGVEPYSLIIDSDFDGIGDQDDNCVFRKNSLQENFDEDPLGDACDLDDENDGVEDGLDVFPFDASESSDADGDGFGDNADPDDDNDLVNDFDANGEVLDNCQYVFNPNQTDRDENGIGDACEDSSFCFPVKSNEKIIVTCF